MNSICITAHSVFIQTFPSCCLTESPKAFGKPTFDSSVVEEGASTEVKASAKPPFKPPINASDHTAGDQAKTDTQT
jgi:hypothetical protein